MSMYPKLIYNLDQFQSCCGIGVIHNVRHDTGGRDYSFGGSRAILPIKFGSKEQQLEDFHEGIMKKLDEKLEGWIDGEGEEIPAYYHHILVALVTNFEDRNEPEQIPELKDFLLTKGWAVQKVFVNPKTNNEVTLLEKVLV